MDVTEKLSREKCTGCGLCSQICPVNCITMIENAEGFLQPIVEKNGCINCGSCIKKCPILSDVVSLSNISDTKYYAAILSDKEKLLRSSSGGVFSALADHILKNGGYVCGCVYNEKMEAVHVLSKKSDTVQKMYGSKYVQSNILNCYAILKQKLDAGEKVLFTGTACQVAAVKSFLGQEYDNLYSVDILCHGVPSPGFFRSFVEYMSKKDEVIDIRFRDKEKNGWGSEHRTSIEYNCAGKKWPFMPAYFSAFFYGLDLRESCYRCKFARIERVSDITIGDYWGSWKKYKKRFQEGISVISINTAKGFRLIEAVRDNFCMFDGISKDEAIWSNDNFEHPVMRPKERDVFYSNTQGYKHTARYTYNTKTYRRKSLVSLYGAIVPERVRIFFHTIKRK